MSHASQIDVEASLKRMNLEVEDLVEMLQAAIPYLQDRMESVCQAGRASDNGRIAADAHAIKGTAAVVGMEALQVQARRVEHVAKGILGADLTQEIEQLSVTMESTLRDVPAAVDILSARTQSPDADQRAPGSKY